MQYDFLRFFFQLFLNDITLFFGLNDTFTYIILEQEGVVCHKLWSYIIICMT